MHTPWWLAATGACLAIVSAYGQEPAPSIRDEVAALSAMSPQNANYDIDVRLDHGARTLTGTEIIRWRNTGQAPADSLRLHLYWNAWRNNHSTFLRERALGGDKTDRPAEDWSYTNVTAIALANADGSAGLDLMPGLTYVQPDDGNADDRTLAAVALPAPVPPGGEVNVRVAWKARVPRTFSRTGAIGNYYFVAQWFPKLAVFEGDRWTAHQFHANTEFFSDYGRYDVRMTVPRGWIVGATGTEQSTAPNADGTVTHRYVQDHVHDFAWTTSPDYVDLREPFREPGLPPVNIRLLLQPEHRNQADRHFAATKAALKYYGQWYGPYPYPQLTVIDPAYQSDVGGMEYPTLFTAGTRLFSPRQTFDPESVVVHEAGHQFWYALVGNNEFEDAWLDEGLNRYSEQRVQAAAFEPNYLVERFFGGFIPWQFRDIALKRETDGNLLNFYRADAESDAQNTPTYRYWPISHWVTTYGKTALWLSTLERHLGWDMLQRILSTFFERWRFKHPRPEDFFALVNEVSGRDMTWFFDQVYRSSNTFDYGVASFESELTSMRGFAGDGAADPTYKDDRSTSAYRTTVVVRRFGEAIFPVDVLVTLENGDHIREKWDGVDRWKSFTYERPNRGRTAQLDPERILLLDVNYTNNSRTLEPHAEEAATKWSLKWMVWLQDLMLTWSFFV